MGGVPRISSKWRLNFKGKKVKHHRQGVSGVSNSFSRRGFRGRMATAHAREGVGYDIKGTIGLYGEGIGEIGGQI
ncbi:hypothetical protein A3Q56_08631 [Intoshia linei]|uniref:Uncharacterized protein n=1 Tax=Intoshia linei TaxID=1819745 RepID=A0A177AQK3_9BILA|nr:hypothetical protein A3Q56_08631 [Intoshia linei]